MSERISKGFLRQEVRQRLGMFTAEQRHQRSTSICDHLRRMISEGNDSEGVVGVFSPTAIEPDITRWTHELMGSRSVCFPLMDPILGPGGMRFFKVRSMSELAPEPRFGGRWMEPSPKGQEVHPEEISLILVPVVAIDCQGLRLGHGGGFYDRYLARLRRGARRVAVAFEIQRVVEVPAESHDARMDALVTETGEHRFNRA